MHDSLCYTKTVLILTAVLIIIFLISNQSSLAQNQYHEAKIQFEEASYATKKMSCNPSDNLNTDVQERKKATIIVTDPDENKFDGSIDRIKVFISSDTDPKGIVITAYETHLNSGLFEGTFLIDEAQSTENKIQVSNGDTLHAKYTDTTLPSEQKSDSIEVTATSFIGVSCPPLERVPASNPTIVDNKGQKSSSINVDQQIQITCKVKNLQDRKQPFAYLIQIQNEDGVTVSLSWITGLLEPKQTMNPSQSWLATGAGKYNVQIYVWESIENADALSPPLSLEVEAI